MGSAEVIEEHEVASLESLIVVDSPSTLCPVSSETMERSQFRAWGGGVLPTLDARGLFLGLAFQVLAVVL